MDKTVIITELNVWKELLFSGDMLLLRILFLMTLFDVVSGISKGFAKNELRSRRASEGLARKAHMYFIVIMANVIDQAFNGNGMGVNAVVIFYIVVESLSLIENAKQLGLPIPDVITEKLAMFENGKQVKEIVPGDATTTIVKDKNGDIKDVEVKVENK